MRQHSWQSLSAAYDFRSAHMKERVKNKASGALESNTIVTFEEMLEHSFYHGLNFVQIVFLHSAPLLKSPPPSSLCRTARHGAMAFSWLVSCPQLLGQLLQTRAGSMGACRGSLSPQEVSVSAIQARPASRPECLSRIARNSTWASE